MPDWEGYKEVVCPECGNEDCVDVDDTEIICESCNHQYSIYFDE